MRHLSPEAFVDVLDGVSGDAERAHLDACASCRRELADLQAAWQVALPADVPEPSPLFWEQFSNRVRERVSAEPPVSTVGQRLLKIWRRGPTWNWQLGAAAGLAAAVLVGLVTLLPTGSPAGPEPAADQTAIVRAPVADADNGPTADGAWDDASLAVVADLMSELDWDGALDLGFTPDGGAELALGDLSTEERVELKRLLAEAMADGA